ncbi:MAG: nucleoside-diphosphate kinase [Actinomycetota bacterium]|nr:nucleoside-diphosphate kinase [Actinomycetota bacterium]
MVQRTLSIIKPDAVQKNAVGAILKYFEDAGLKIRALKMMKLSMEEAKAFYIVHKERPFYNELATFMSEGPIVPLVLEGQDAIKRVRDIMGATNPKDAAPGTIRATFATNIERNAVHGSDSEKSAAYEIPFFFSALEIPEI